MISKKIECYAIHRTNMAQNGCTVQCKECAEVQQNKRQNVPGSFASYYQPLFDHMSQQHGLTLLQGEMDEIIRVVKEMTDQPDLLPFQWPVKEGYEVVTRDGRKVEKVSEPDIDDNVIYMGEQGRWQCEGVSRLFLCRMEKKVWVVELDNEIVVASHYSLEEAIANTTKDTIIYEATLKPVV